MTDSRKKEPEKQKKKKVFRGERLQSVRSDREWTQATLAELIGVQEYTVSRYETGAQEPRYEHLQLMCQELNVSADYLLGIVDEHYLLHPIQYKERKTLPELKESKALRPEDGQAAADRTAEKLAESLEAVKLLERFTERSLAFERGFNHRTKRYLELWSQMSEQEKEEQLQSLENRLKERQDG